MGYKRKYSYESGEALPLRKECTCEYVEPSQPSQPSPSQPSHPPSPIPSVGIITIAASLGLILMLMR